jgi:hypothetical protein
MPIDELELKCVFLTFYSTKKKPCVLKKLPSHRHAWPYLNLAILFKPICITALKTFIYLTFQSYLMKVIPKTHRVYLIRYGEVYSIQVYVIRFVSDLRQVGGFLQFPITIKTATI